MLLYSEKICFSFKKFLMPFKLRKNISNVFLFKYSILKTNECRNVIVVNVGMQENVIIKSFISTFLFLLILLKLRKFFIVFQNTMNSEVVFVQSRS